MLTPSRPVRLLLGYPQYTVAQSTTFLSGPEGYYEGALIRGNSVSLLTADLKMINDTLMAECNVKEWTWYESVRTPVMEDGNVLRFGTHYGMATMVYDSTYGEMVGTLNGGNPPLQLHFKKVRRPLTPPIEVRELSVDCEDIGLPATLFLPEAYAKPLPCAIFVHGRGNATRENFRQRARILATYGMATMIYDKRGANGTGYDYDITTIKQHTNDLLYALDLASQVPEIDPAKIGFIATSYGGWIAPKAAAQSPREVAFIISMVGPSTSVQQQQLDASATYVRDILKANEEMILEVQEYTDLMYDESDTDNNFYRMKVLLQSAERNGWLPVLDDDDLIDNKEDMKALWVRRNRYDPGQDLQSFKGPFLSILGEKDWVVPYRENSLRFEALFSEIGKKNYHIVVLPSAPHWLEHGNVLRDLGWVSSLSSTHYYYKFDRVVPGVMDEMVLFLKKYDFLP